MVTSTLVFEGDGRIGEYVGGYTDWLRQRKAPMSAGGGRPKPAETPAATPQEKAAGKPKKLSYKDQRELDALPARIESLENEQSELQAVTSDPGFYQQDQETITATLARLESVVGELEACFARWEELEG